MSDCTTNPSVPVYASYGLREQLIDNATISHAAFRDLDIILQAIIATSEKDSLPRQLASVGRHIAEDQANYFDSEREGLQHQREVSA